MLNTTIYTVGNYILGKILYEQKRHKGENF